MGAQLNEEVKLFYYPRAHNVIGLVSMYIYYVIKFFFVIEQTSLIYLKFVATDFSLKIISPSAGENSGDSA